MHKILLSTLSYFSIAMLTSCTKHPEKIKPQYITPTIYQSWNCDQLIAEHNRLLRHLNDAHTAQTKAANNDAAATAVGIVLFFPSLFFLGDDARATEYARLKGEFNALEQALVTKSCNLNSLDKIKS